MSTDDRSLEDGLVIDRACLDFEDAYRAGDEPSLEAALGLVPEHLRAELANELRALRTELEETARGSVELVGSPAAPSRVGRYAVGEVVGQGGMGTVFEAVQDQPRRRVALKLIRTDRVSAREVRRFRREAGVLGHLHHPCIAQVYEAGTARPAEGGPELPYLVMEYIDGLPLLEHAERRGLDLDERVALLVRVCAAVQHAHDQGVVHRDLKPANILVREGSSSARGEVDAEDRLGRPIVLDFGLARAIGLDGLDSIETGAGQIVGTLSHMAPEQVMGLQERVDGRADVYSLGVVLYEILGGRLPLELAGLSLPDAVDAIRGREPAPLGTLDPRLRGDLEIICRKALEKDPVRRYGSPAEFGADLQRVLDQEPIRARPPSARYQLQKFARRNPMLVGSFAAAAATLVIALALVLRHAAQEADLRAEAEAERDKVAAVGEFQARILSGANLEEGGRPREVTLLDAIRTAAEGIDTAYPDAPEVESAVRLHLGRAFLSMDEPKRAELHFRRAVELREKLAGEEHVDTLQAFIGLARSVEADARFAEARPLAERAVELSKRIHGERHEHTLSTMNNLATLLDSQGEYAEALALHRQVLALREELFGPESEAVSLSLNNLASLLEIMEELDEAEALYRRCLALRRKLYEPPHQRLGNVINNLGAMLLRGGRLDEAEPFLLEALSMRERLLGEEHPEVATSLNNLAVLDQLRGNAAAAADKMQRALDIHEAHHGVGHPSGDVYRSNVVMLRRRAGQVQQAYELQVRNLEILRESRGDDHEKTLRGVDILVRCVLELGRIDEAEALAAQNLADVRRALDECRLTGTCLERMAEIALRRERPTEALPFAKDAVEVHERFGADHPGTLNAHLLLAKVTYGCGDRAEGRALGEALLVRCEELLGKGHVYTRNTAEFLDESR